MKYKVAIEALYVTAPFLPRILCNSKQKSACLAAQRKLPEKKVLFEVRLVNLGKLCPSRECQTYSIGQEPRRGQLFFVFSEVFIKIAGHYDVGNTNVVLGTGNCTQDECFKCQFEKMEVLQFLSHLNQALSFGIVVWDSKLLRHGSWGEQQPWSQFLEHLTVLLKNELCLLLLLPPPPPSPANPQFNVDFKPLRLAPICQH